MTVKRSSSFRPKLAARQTFRDKISIFRKGIDFSKTSRARPSRQPIPIKSMDSRGIGADGLYAPISISARTRTLRYLRSSANIKLPANIPSFLSPSSIQLLPPSFLFQFNFPEYRGKGKRGKRSIYHSNESKEKREVTTTQRCAINRVAWRNMLETRSRSSFGGDASHRVIDGRMIHRECLERALGRDYFSRKSIPLLSFIIHRSSIYTYTYIYIQRRTGRQMRTLVIDQDAF